MIAITRPRISVFAKIWVLLAAAYWAIGVEVSMTPAGEGPAIVLQNVSLMPGSWRTERLPAEFVPMWNRSESLSDRHKHEEQALPKIAFGSGAALLHRVSVRLQI